MVTVAVRLFPAVTVGEESVKLLMPPLPDIALATVSAPHFAEGTPLEFEVTVLGAAAGGEDGEGCEEDERASGRKGGIHLVVS